MDSKKLPKYLKNPERTLISVFARGITPHRFVPDKFDAYESYPQMKTKIFDYS